MNDLKGKKILFLGDSITEGYGASSPDKNYVSVFGRLSGAKVYNYGIGGTRIAASRKELSEPIKNQYFLTRLSRMESEADYVIVFGGTNDYGHENAPFGTYKDSMNETFCGALRNLIVALYEKYPLSRIVFVTPLHREAELTGLTDKGNPVSARFIEYVHAIRDICEEYSIPVIDLYSKSNIQARTAETKRRLIPDGLHPSDEGYRRIAEIIYNFLTNM